MGALCMPFSQVRLNEKYYDEQEFLDAGIDHLDAYFVDGSVPPPSVLRQFISTCEATPGAIAVHCKVRYSCGVMWCGSLSLSLCRFCACCRGNLLTTKT